MPILNHYLLGDEGYLGKDLAAKLKHMGYVLWTPSRKKIYKIEHLLDNAKKLRTDHNFDLYDLRCLINTILNKYMTEQTLQIKFDKEKLKQIIKSPGISVKLDNKHLTILQELLNRLKLILTKYAWC